MDAPDNRSRELIASRGELVGAVRLPAGALRPGLPGNDAVVDLLIFRRPLIPGSHITPCTFLPTHEQRPSNSIVLVNQYWLAHPHHVLGDLDTRLSPWAPCTLTVRPTPGHRLFANLSLRLEDIVDHAHATGLTAETGAAVDARLRDAARRPGRAERLPPRSETRPGQRPPRGGQATRRLPAREPQRRQGCSRRAAGHGPHASAFGALAPGSAPGRSPATHHRLRHRKQTRPDPVCDRPRKAQPGGRTRRSWDHA